MGANSKIAWTDHTFSPVRGCRHAVLLDGTVSPACPACYAETMSKRNPKQLGTWGAAGERVFASETYWRQPLAWNEAARAAGVAARVFCASLSDIFEGEDFDGAETWIAIRPDYLPMLDRLFALIRATPWLRWQLLTKRPWNMEWWARRHGWPDNAWAGTTVENQAAADERIPWVNRVGAGATRFLSCEPLAGRINIERMGVTTARIDWVIIGGQSGAYAPVLDLPAVRDLIGQCQRAGIKVFVKQLGSAWATANGRNELGDTKGTDPGVWPEDLRIQEFPDDS